MTGKGGDIAVAQSENLLFGKQASRRSRLIAADAGNAPEGIQSRAISLRGEQLQPANSRNPEVFKQGSFTDRMDHKTQVISLQEMIEIARTEETRRRRAVAMLHSGARAED